MASIDPTRISIFLSDPWDLGEALNWRPLTGELLQTATHEHGGRGLIKLDAPIQYRNGSWRYVVASPRHKGDDIAGILAGKKVFCTFMGVSDQQAASRNPFDTGGWRGGGLTFIGDIEPVTE